MSIQCATCVFLPILCSHWFGLIKAVIPEFSYVSQLLRSYTVGVRDIKQHYSIYVFRISQDSIYCYHELLWSKTFLFWLHSFLVLDYTFITDLTNFRFALYDCLNVKLYGLLFVAEC